MGQDYATAPLRIVLVWTARLIPLSISTVSFQKSKQTQKNSILCAPFKAVEVGYLIKA